MLINLRNALMAGEKTPPYVQDGLVFMEEGISPPASGIQSVNIGVDVLPSDFTIEWCGIHAGNTRSGIFVNPCPQNDKTLSFGFGWWMDSNTVDINSRIYYSETNSGVAAGGRTQFALTVSNGSEAVFYKAGVSFNTDTNLVAGAITQMTQGGSSTWRYINCGQLDYVDFDILRVYSRALTAAEIAANYAIDKARFGLP